MVFSPAYQGMKVEKLEKTIPREGPIVTLVLDGVGISKPDGKDGDAYIIAETPVLDELTAEAKARKLFCHLKAHGSAVGLPTEDDMGNSEVGHNALGAGQIIAQGAKLVNQLLVDSDDILKTQNWADFIEYAAKKDKSIHLFGLLSDGGIHSHFDQLTALVSKIAATGVRSVIVHPLLDGRDVPPTSGLEYIDMLEKLLEDVNKAHSGFSYRIGSGGGRMHCIMDRYGSDWSMVERGFNTMVHGHIDESELVSGYKGYYCCAKAAVEHARELFPEKKDQYNPPFVVVDSEGKPIGMVEDGDVVININYRGDRAVEISQVFDCPETEKFPQFDRSAIRPYPKGIKYAGLLEYDSETKIPKSFLVPPPSISSVSSELICAAGLRTYAVAETHKFGHVSFFWNGNRSGLIDDKLEKYEEVVSYPNSETEKKPEMKAPEVTKKLCDAIRSGKFENIRCNLANGDMVGHTGSLEAAVKAMEAVDACVGEIKKAVEETGGVLMITADHGNAEVMMKKGKPVTSHTCNPVPFIIFDPKFAGEYELCADSIDTPGLTNITATFLNFLGIKAPEFYRKSLIKLL
ncbi:Probable 2,3-bisphosphoglycerate-independent phosphoglycerate mutase [Aduncisulcus paluster]|uniref:phosphoglycerate mutase (2,3-diphosphoglycerate-independent) n=1 Tax=Aduncisulcus paluster TaxID=2918883 RepID=A0ABQ5JYA8_9EUKA|nr:Probable 2,3-bisphosphoglycerate-independent phosphoglycerate mutase [Aduncisulcus paluster]